MEEVVNPNSCRRLQSQPRILSVSESSREITKLKPKIRIVHIFAPEIIKTDPANFRELVQRLTGKPSKIIESRKKKKDKKALPATANAEATMRCKQEDVGVKRELDKEEEERELWVGSNSGAGFLRELGEMDGFFQGGLEFKRGQD
ncbi:VQ motif-containing protein 25-like isoform X2 [Typha angustifolia]|uniref:VQ motif-containing protein 25-like isoform X2 n=1 Tax=Typha angustifolia TaxID=59011 RepID=UPI003C2D91F4